MVSALSAASWFRNVCSLQIFFTTRSSLLYRAFADMHALSQSVVGRSYSLLKYLISWKRKSPICDATILGTSCKVLLLPDAV